MVKSKPRALGIIPARGGSKRLPRKNLRKLDGKPLICYTIEAAILSECFDNILFSSDDAELLELAREYPEITIEKRPEHLATDTSKVIELVKQIAGREDFKSQFDLLSLLLPTCPFRTADHVRGAFDLMSEDIDCVVSMTTFDFPPQLSMKVDKTSSLLVPAFNECGLVTGNTRSQDQELVLHPNGGIYLSWWRSFEKYQNWFSGRVKPLIMPRQFSMDIDEELDFTLAEFMLKKRLISL